MIIEFAGLSGSGKSHAVRALSLEEDVRVVRAPGKESLLWHGVLFTLFHPGAAVRLLGAILKEPRTLRRLLFMNAFLVPAAKYRTARRLRAPFVLIDQCFAQAHLALSDAPDGLPFADAVVIGTVDEDTQRARLRSRGHSPRADGGEASTFLAQQRSRLPRLERALDAACVPRYDLAAFMDDRRGWRRALAENSR